MQPSETYKGFKEVKVNDEKGNFAGRRIGEGSEQFEGQKKCRDPKSGKKRFWHNNEGFLHVDTGRGKNPPCVEPGWELAR